MSLVSYQEVLQGFEIDTRELLRGTKENNTYFTDDFKSGQTVPLCQMISDDIIVRASNPGQFESDSESVWSRDCTTGAIYHSGNVAINTDRASEALTVNGNIQLTGQVMNW